MYPRDRGVRRNIPVSINTLQARGKVTATKPVSLFGYGYVLKN